MIAAALEQSAHAVRALFKTRKMSGRDVLCAELIGSIDQPAKFQILITHHARIGRPTSFVFLGEVMNHLFFELFSFIDQVVRDAQFVTNGAGIRYSLGPAALVLSPRDA